MFNKQKTSSQMQYQGLLQQEGAYDVEGAGIGLHGCCHVPMGGQESPITISTSAAQYTGQYFSQYAISISRNHAGRDWLARSPQVMAYAGEGNSIPSYHLFKIHSQPKQGHLKSQTKEKNFPATRESLVKKSINSSGNIDQKRRRDQYNKRRHGMDGGFAATRQHPQPDLNHIHHRQHQKHTTHDRSESGPQHPESQRLQIDVGPERLVDVLAVEQVDGQLQSLRHQRREQEEAEGDNLEHQQLLRHVDPGVAGCPVLEAPLSRSCQGEPHEDGDGEE
ncbi:hypothetical protein C1H46_004903 [Malus baccata]|uniref:Uncharacterized protein n=1 Tax=Malus baccata TaxID=106549 RepID=A0A540NFW3_MALBA|nr:hypothetical protein C1H46_004903 [Malus baccata]